jgi:hypothetical protein
VTKICDILEKKKNKFNSYFFKIWQNFDQKIMENVDRSVFIFGISKRIAQKSCNHKSTLGF